MLAYGMPEHEPTVLDRFYWRPEPARKQGRREMMLMGKVWKSYLSPQGQAAGAILENGDVIRVEPPAGDHFKDRFAEGARIVAAGTGVETPLGKAIDAEPHRRDGRQARTGAGGASGFPDRRRAAGAMSVVRARPGR